MTDTPGSGKPRRARLAVGAGPWGRRRQL